MKIVIEVECELCHAKTKTNPFKRPEHFQPMFITLTCSGCESQHSLKMTRPRTPENKSLADVFTLGIVRSEKWLRMIEGKNETEFRIGW